MKAAVFVLALILAGCASTPKERIVIREVKVPVPVACKPQIPEKPAYADDQVNLSADLFDLVQALLVGREQRKAREVELEAVAKGCGG